MRAACFKVILLVYHVCMANLVKLTPHVVEKVWGGHQLAQLKGWDITTKVGETWEVSTHSAGSSKFNGVALNSLTQLSYLVKFIDTTDNLSIQVHPDDEYAQKENDKGKTECWLILAAKEGSGIYLGFKPEITRKEFKTAVDNGLQVDQFLNFIPVKAGDFFYVPAGAVHAIGSGVTLCEVQQASGITYRVWDWNRVGMDGKPRELHIDKAMDVLEFSDKFNQELLKKSRKSLFSSKDFIKLVEHEDFKAQMFSITNDLELTLKEKESIVLLDGSLEIDGFALDAYQSAIVMEGGFVKIHAKKPSRFLVVSE
jgi:mannose-6-phosphate isomerase